MLYISITFDYELFMGENYVDEEEVLISPTSKLSTMLSEEGISGVFFADVCSPMRYRELGKKDFSDMLDEQLVELVGQGHDVQLHIHPHWLTATKVGKHIEFDRNYYRLHNWEKESSGSMKKIIHDGIEYLKDVIRPVDQDYRCVAYRAGGYCLQPEEQLADILYNEGIRIDSSVCVGFSHDGDGMYYDYKSLKPYRNFYFNKMHPITMQHEDRINEAIFEVPVGSYGRFPQRIVASKINRKITSRPNNGTGMKLSLTQVTNKKPIWNRVEKSIHAFNMVTFDFYNAASMKYMIEHICKEQNCSNRDVFLATISHPKLLSDEHIDNMRKAIVGLKRNPNICFVNMQDIAKIIQL